MMCKACCSDTRLELNASNLGRTAREYEFGDRHARIEHSEPSTLVQFEISNTLGERCSVSEDRDRDAILMFVKTRVGRPMATIMTMPAASHARPHSKVRDGGHYRTGTGFWILSC